MNRLSRQEVESLRLELESRELVELDVDSFRTRRRAVSATQRIQRHVSTPPGSIRLCHRYDFEDAVEDVVCGDAVGVSLVAENQAVAQTVMNHCPDVIRGHVITCA